MHVLNCPGICKKLETRGVSEIKCEFLKKRKDRKIIIPRFFNIDVTDPNTLLVSLLLKPFLAYIEVLEIDGNAEKRVFGPNLDG